MRLNIYIFVALTNILANINAQNNEIEGFLLKANQLLSDAKEIIMVLKSMNLTEEEANLEHEIIAIKEMTDEIRVILLNQTTFEKDFIKILTENFKVRLDWFENVLKIFSETNGITVQPITTKTTTLATIQPITTITTSTTTKPFSCSDISQITYVCHCFYMSNETSNIRCEDKQINDENFSNFMKLLPEVTFKYLDINNTGIKVIGKNAFGKTKFTRIYIENNQQLEKIDENAFIENENTEILIIRNNPKITEDIFNVVRNFKNIWHLELDRNGISIIPSYALNSFEKLDRIFLNDQNGVGLKIIKENAISNLKNLTQLLLENNKLEKLENHAIDITKSNRHVYVNLAHNNLGESSLTTDTIVTKVQTELNVFVNLDYNSIKSVKSNSLIQYFAETINGTISIRNNAIDCTCADFANIEWTNATYKLRNIYGLPETLCKVDNETVAQCLNIK